MAVPRPTTACTDDASCADTTEAVGQPGEEAGAEFGGAMAVAEMLAGSAALAQKNQQAPPNTGLLLQAGGSSVAQGEAPEVQQLPLGKVAAREAGKFEKSAPRSPELGEEAGALIQKMAVGSNTGAEIAGLKPWSKEWVMEGGLNRHPLQKTLLEADTRGESADAASRLAGLAKLMAAASAQSRGSVDKDAQIESMAGSEGLDGLQPEGEGQFPAPGMVAGLEGAEYSVRKPAAGRNKKTLSGNDFLSIRQGAATEAGSSPTAASGNLKVIPGGLQAPVVTAPVTGGGKPKDPMQSGPQAGPQANDTLGLIHPEMNPKAGAALNRSALPFAAAPGTLQMNGAVVPGAMQRNRLSSESVLGVSQGIRELRASGGGEMRLRLKPDHLGELHLKVSAGGRAGNEIALQIQASDDRARKILEESITSLKDGLAGQSLTLSKVDVQVAPAVSSSASSNSFQQDGLLNPNLASQQDGSMSGRNSSQGEPRERMDGLRSGPGKTASQAFSGATRASAGSATGSGRIDVMA